MIITATNVIIYMGQNKEAIWKFGRDAGNGVVIFENTVIEKNPFADNKINVIVDEALIIDDKVKLASPVQSQKHADASLAIRHDKKTEIKKVDTPIDKAVPLKMISSVADKDGNLITPMYIIDGEEKNEETMNNAIANDNIEKIEVLYKEKAVPMYGERAKNSVVLVTTKKPIVQP